MADVEALLADVVQPLRDALDEVDSQQGEIESRLEEIRSKRRKIVGTLRSLGEEVPVRGAQKRVNRNGGRRARTSADSRDTVLAAVTKPMTLQEIMSKGVDLHPTTVRETLNMLREEETPRIRLAGKRGRNLLYAPVNGGK